MKKYDNILKRVEQVEYKLGISYQKTNGKLYKSLYIVKLLAVIYLICVNLLILLGSAMVSSHSGNVLPTQTLVLIALGTIFELLGVIKPIDKNFPIIANAAAIPQLVYYTVIFADNFSHPDGLLGISSKFYFRHAIDYLFILIPAMVMLFIAIREKYITNRNYKRIVTNLYNNYVNEKKSDGLEINDDEWEKFIINYNPGKLSE